MPCFCAIHSCVASASAYCSGTAWYAPSATVKGAHDAHVTADLRLIFIFCFRLPPRLLRTQFNKQRHLHPTALGAGGQQKQSNDPGNNQHILNTPIIECR